MSVMLISAAAMSAASMPTAGAGPGAFRHRDLPCHHENPDLFFAERPSDIARAKQVCSPCPLRAACLAAALQRQEPWGVWGGEWVSAGSVIAVKRGRGRPRKIDVA